MEFQGWDAGLALRPRDYLGSGESLADVVRAGGPFRGEALHRLALDVAATLARLHMAGIAGLRLHPGNVMIAHNGRAFFAPGPRTSDFPSQDVRDWADVIVFAATGRRPAADAQPGLDALPPGLRTMIAGCRRQYPSARPTAVDLVHRLLGRPGVAHRDTVPELLREAEDRAGPDDRVPPGDATPAPSRNRDDPATPAPSRNRDDPATLAPSRNREEPVALASRPDWEEPVALAPWPNQEEPVTLAPLSHPSTPVTRKARSRPSVPGARKPRSHPSAPVTRGSRARAEATATPARFPHEHPLDALDPLPGKDAAAAGHRPPPPEYVLVVPAPPPPEESRVRTPPPDDVPVHPGVPPAEDVPVHRAVPPPDDVRVFSAPLPVAAVPVEYEETLVEPAPVWRRPSYFVGVAVGVLIVAVSAGAVTAVSARADTLPQGGHLFPTNGGEPNPAAGEFTGSTR
ncbi:hypothetical protein [Nonomuraea jiangxiensis]|uniref:Protein kinase domain-containing protein n=1 Tax=Nonomuraea jiangxiensis TaxID=633440 RepID=A0A1G8LEU2_9ACTN|nr:hypothetical protein [Nonomuraea jiangxiensis]SDI54181.1 hypothetical protein SAMN05421869_10673 [Nonomuraea jiangxiensis]